MIGIRVASNWRFETAGSGGVGLEFVAATGGVLKLFDPQGKEVVFHYGALGAGLTYGFKIPYIGKVNFKLKGKAVVVSVAPTFFKNGGEVFITDAFSGNELKKADIQGATLFLDGSLALIGGVSGSAMLLGIDPAMLISAIMNPALRPILLPTVIARAPAALIMGGATAMLQVGAGGALYVGFLG